MKKTLLPLIMALFFIVLSAPAPLPAGQIVTDQLKSWARTAAAEKPSARKPPVPGSVAVLYFSNRTGRSDITPLQKGLPLMLSTDLSRIKGLRVIERARIQALYDALGLKPSSPISADTALRMGKMLGAFYVVSASIARGRITDLKITANCVEVPNDMLLDQPVSAGDLADLVSMEKEILFDLINAFQIALKPDQMKGLETPVSADIDALYLLFRGIDASDRGKYESAAELYKKALRQDPQLAVASSALAELQTKVFMARAPRAPAAPAPAKPTAAPTAPKTPAASAPAAVAAVPAIKPAPAQAPVPAPPPSPAAPKAETTPPPAAESPSGGTKSALEEEKRLSTGTIVAIGLGAAVAIGGIAAAAGSGGGGGGEAPAPAPPPEPEPPPAGPQITGVDPPVGSAVSCTAMSVTFTFDRDMDIAAGQIGVSVPDWQFSGSFTDARTYVISWEDNCPESEDPADLPAAITFVFANFQDTSQNPLEGDVEFTFDLTM